MKLTVDKQQRKAKMRAHTATHLLHFALGQELGMTKQAGSLVDSDYLRFDFSAKEPLTEKQLYAIQDQINKRIQGAYNVEVDECSLEEAKERGAKAFFEDKYGDRVRIVTIEGGQKAQEALTSIELCGGTHVNTTDEIGVFIITGQEAVASGIRRITAITGPKVATHYKETTSLLSNIAESLDCQTKQIEEKIEKLLEERDDLRAQQEKQQDKRIQNVLQDIKRSEHEQFDYIFNINELGLEDIDIKNIIQIAKQLFSEQDRFLFTKSGIFALYMGASKNALELRKEHQIKGGGDAILLQGKDPSLQEKLLS